MPLLTERMLTDIGVTRARAAQHLPALNDRLPRHAIDTPLRLAHFLSQCLHESMLLARLTENLNYSADGLRATFPRYFTRAEAEAYARQPRRIASRAYANRLGNGDEASGDGWRYRGRGLIQLTGRDNYAAFARWLGEDVVAAPDRVADEFPVDAAVFFWLENGINALADADDVNAVTRRVNGGLNGLAERIRLLDRAKTAIGAQRVEVRAPAADWRRVTASLLNLRSSAGVKADNRLASLPQGTRVAVVGQSSLEGWVEVRATLDGQVLQGFVAASHLEAMPADAPPAPVAPAVVAVPAPAAPPAPVAPPVHLSQGRADITRTRDGGRAHPLGEPGAPRRIGTTPAARARALVRVVAYLDSENPAHLRYRKKGGTTFCNIYAYDYCCLAGVYLPRVWWTASALLAFARGETPPVEYARTVTELTANALHDWLVEHGAGYGWQRLTDLDTLQAAANAGEPCLLVAQRAERSAPGHIVAVVPEHDAHLAARSREGAVLRPLQSEAGADNRRFVARSRAWWTDAKFGAFSFWRNA